MFGRVWRALPALCLCVLAAGCSGDGRFLNAHPAPTATPVPPSIQALHFSYVGNFNPAVAGVYPITVTAYSDQSATTQIPSSTQLSTPITIASNDSGQVAFSSTGGAGTATMLLPTPGSPAYLVWTPCAVGDTSCVTPNIITITLTSGTVSISNDISTL